MAEVRIRVSTGDGLTIEYDRDDLIVDRCGGRTARLLDDGYATVRARLVGSTDGGLGGDHA